MPKPAVATTVQSDNCPRADAANRRGIIAALLALTIFASVLPPAAAAPLPDCSGCDPTRVEQCGLHYGAYGVVSDQLSGVPIQGATITVLDLEGVSGADGSYHVEATRPEQCHLDYFYTVQATAPGYEPFFLQLYANFTFIEMSIGLVPENAPRYAVSGTVAEFLPCSGRMRGVTVVLEPLGLSVQTGLGPDDGGTFRFEGVRPGNYILRVAQDCSQIEGCWRETPVQVVAADVSADVCLEPDVEPSPTACPVATPCAIGQFPRPCLEHPCGLSCGCEPCAPCPEGETRAPQASLCECVPGSAPTPTATPSPESQRTVPATPTQLACAGDCNADGAVGIDELIAAVGRALGVTAMSGGCDSFDRNRDGSVAIDDLVALVGVALRGCAA